MEREKLQMKIKNILISQIAPTDFGKSPYAELKKKYSVNIDFYKFFKIESISSIEFRKSKVNLNQYDSVVFSSKNTIDQFFNLLKEMRFENTEELKYFCTTETIALYLQKYIQFRKRKIFFPKTASVNGIYDVLLKNKDNSFLIPCGSDTRSTPFSEFFDQHEIKYTHAVVFNTVPADIAHDVDLSKYDLIVFFSPFGIQSLKFNFPDFKQGDVAFGALGSAVAAAVEAEGWTLNVFAPTKEYPSITAAIDAFLKEYATRRR